MENFFNYIKFAFLRSFFAVRSRSGASTKFSSVERMPPNGDLLRSMKNFHHEKIIVTKPKLECSGECFFSSLDANFFTAQEKRLKR